MIQAQATYCLFAYFEVQMVFIRRKVPSISRLASRSNHVVQTHFVTRFDSNSLHVGIEGVERCLPRFERETHL